MYAGQKTRGDSLPSKKLIIFAVHTSTCEAVAEKYGDLCAGIIYGGTSQAKRQEIVDAFQNDPEKRIIVGNVQAMGVGLTLTAASDVLFLESPWRPSDIDQAEDRANRIGQIEPVTCYHMIAPGTIDDEIRDLIESKRVVTGAVIEGQKEDPHVVSSFMTKLVDRTKTAQQIREIEAQAMIEGNFDSFKPAAVQTKPLRDGYYTVSLDGDSVTIRIRTWKGHEPMQVASYLYGPSNTTDYRGFATIDGGQYKIWSAMQGNRKLEKSLLVLMGGDNLEEYQRAYAVESKRCFMCGKLLTTPESIAAGIGPDCAKRA